MTAPVEARPEKGEKVTTDMVRRALRARHGSVAGNGREWAFFEEVRDAAGFGASRSADAVAMHLWPSQGLALHGFEIKVSRADWLRELDNPGKWEGVGAYCDRWWIVAPKRVVLPGELPPLWGLMTYDAGGGYTHEGDRLRVQTKAPQRTDVKPLDRSFVACLLRRAAESSATTADIAAARAEGEKLAHERASARAENQRLEFETLRRTVDDFEQRAGVRLSAYNGPRLAEALELVQAGGGKALVNRLEAFARELSHLSETTTAALARVRAAVPEVGA